MTYYPDGTLLRRPSVLTWLGGDHRDAFGVYSTFGGARRRRSWQTFGWLELGHDFATGVCPGELPLLLEDSGKHPVDKTRGYHICPFCPRPCTEFGPTPYTTADGTQLLLGDASLEVRDATGQVWIAPTLVLHYITVHRYLPPGELADAMAVRASGGCCDGQHPRVMAGRVRHTADGYAQSAGIGMLTGAGGSAAGSGIGLASEKLLGGVGVRTMKHVGHPCRLSAIPWQRGG